MSGDDKSARPKLNDLLDRQIAYLESQPKGQSFETQFRLAMQVYQEVTEFARNLEARIDAAPSHVATPVEGEPPFDTLEGGFISENIHILLRQSELLEQEGVHDVTARVLRDGARIVGNVWKERERYRKGMENWKRTAEAKDAAALSSIGTPDEMPTPRTHPTGWTFDRWIALQPYLSKDIGSFTVDGERYYAASTVKGAWIAGEQCVGVSATVTPTGCKQCGGTGTELLIKSMPPNVADTRVCPACGGTGK